LTPLRRKLAWLGDKRGVSAVEFALVAPILIVMFMGLSDLATATLAQLHVNHAAEGTADVVASEQNLYLQSNSPSMADMFTAATYFMTPYSSTPLNVLITDIYYDGNPNHSYGVVYWSCAMNGSASTSASKYQPYTYQTQFQYIPGLSQIASTNITQVLWTKNSLAVGTSVIVVQTSYSFSSPSGFFVKTAQMSSAYATIPRLANYVGFPYTQGATLPAPTATTTPKTASLTLTNGATANCNYGS